MSRRIARTKPLFWGLFAAGGTAAAFLLPVTFFVLFVAAPLGWTGPLAFHDVTETLGRTLARLVLFGLVTLCFFHAAHRLRYTLYDGLQLYHLERLIATVTYGSATLGTLLAGWVFWTMG